MSKTARRVKGGIIIIIIFIGIFFLIQALRDKPLKPRPVIDRSKPSVLKINYSLIGRPFRNLSKLPNEIYPLWKHLHYWYKIHIVVKNNCKEGIILDPSKFQLKFGMELNKTNKHTIPPSKRAIKFQKDRLKEVYLESGKQIRGLLFYEVPKNIAFYKLHYFGGSCNVSIVRN